MARTVVERVEICRMIFQQGTSTAVISQDLHIINHLRQRWK